MEKLTGRPLTDLQSLTTERLNEASTGLDTKSALEIARIINQEDAKVAAAVKKALPEIAIMIDTVARSLRDGGRLIYVGAGSSGRICALDASECPPAFATTPSQVQYIMAGGPKALASASDVNEDSPELGQRDIALPANSRAYLVAGTQHGGTAGMRATLGSCVNLRNPHNPNPALRDAAVTAWIKEGKNGLVTSATISPMVPVSRLRRDRPTMSGSYPSCWAA